MKTTFLDKEGDSHEFWQEMRRVWQTTNQRAGEEEFVEELYAQDTVRLDARVASTPRNAETQSSVAYQVQGDAPTCADCGAITVRSGACYVCLACGSSSGCG